MSSSTPHELRDLDWWLSRLEGAFPSGNGYKAKCPAHRDDKASLQLTLDGEYVLVHDFGGCTYEEILQHLEDGPTLKVTRTLKVSGNGTHQKTSPQEWWEEYTGVPLGEWEAWGVSFNAHQVVFTWGSLPTRKVRKAGTKEFSWEPKNAPAPPLWPYPTRVNTGKRVYLTEGETDAGVLLHLGLKAFAITKGALTPLAPALVALKGLGVKEIVAVFDTDSGGLKGAEALKIECNEAGITFLDYPTCSLVDSFAGEKDLRDFWKRILDKEEALGMFLDQDPRVSVSRISFIGLDDFMQTPIPPETWLVENVWLAQTIGVLAGAPKMGKSWLSLDLAISVATGEPFLGEFKVPEKGAAVIIPMEDPDFLLQDRFSKVLRAKGLSGSVKLPRIQFPRENIPLYLDLERAFSFSGGGAASLFSYLDMIYERHGSIKLVVLDPLLRMLSGVDEYKASEVAGSVFSISSQIQSRYGAAVVLVHHKSKETGGSSKRSYGSIAFHAFSESALYLAGEEPDPDGWVEVEGQYKSSAPTVWGYRLSDLEHGYTSEVTRKGGAKTIDIHAGIVALLKNLKGGCTTEEILNNLPGAPGALVRKTLKVLKDTGIIEADYVVSDTTHRKEKRWILTN